MNIYCLKHVEFENPGLISSWADERNHNFNIVNVYLNEEYPEIDEIDMLIIMGGPMNIYEYDKYSWLKKEKEFIEKIISNNKKALGVCLGAQLISAALGGQVVKGQNKEIGWFEVEKTCQNSYFLEEFPSLISVFHWHGDTFSIPEKANHILKSKACLNQAFEYENRILALQFHIEMTEKNIINICDNCSEELDEEGEYIQNRDEILQKSIGKIDQNKKMLFSILDKFSLKTP